MGLWLIFPVAFAIGGFSGLRALTPLAVISWLSIWGWIPLAGSPIWFVGTTVFATIASIAAFAELIGDKLPSTSARISPVPLTVRIVNGALSAAALCFAAGSSLLLGVFTGGIGAACGAYGGYHARRMLVQRLRVRDLPVALLEDLVTIIGAAALIRGFFNTPV